MQNRMARVMVVVISTGCLAMLVNGCSMMGKTKSKEHDISMSQMSVPARTTAEKQTAGGHVDKVTEETERGRRVYDVEATVGGRHMEYLIAADNGELLGTEVPVEFGQLPEPVKNAARNYFGDTAGLKAMKGVEYGETHYEIEGMKAGKMRAVSYD